MKLNIFTLSGGNWSVQVPPDMTIADLRALARSEAGLDEDQLVKLHGSGRELTNGEESLLQAGLKDGGMVMIENYNNAVGGDPSGRTAAVGVTGQSIGIDFGKIAIPTSGSSTSINGSGGNHGSASGPVAGTSRSSGRSAGPAGGSSGPGSEMDQLWQAMTTDPRTLSLLKERNPDLADAFTTNNKVKFQEVLNKQMAERREQEMNRIRLLSADPFDADAQRKIQEAIDAENINSVLEHAMEFNPEMFSTVTMLYINCHVNNLPIKAFVDSGAQSTIISVKCAQRCNLLRLVDKRFSGIAKGVGEQKIIGKIHLAQLQIENDFLPTSFIVLEDQSMDMLLGLDMLKRHQCIIDLKNNCLKIGVSGTETQFLSEADLPASAHLEGRRSGPVSPNPHGAAPAGPSVAKPVAEQHSFPEEDIAKIVEMGFDRTATIAALTQAGGNAENALAILLAASARS